MAGGQAAIMPTCRRYAAFLQDFRVTVRDDQMNGTVQHIDSAIDVLLVGYENQENLGLRSIMAYLLKQGYTVRLVPFIPGRDSEILRIAEKFQPRLIGFSLIFQYSLGEFASLMRFLRINGIKAHFTAGGHYPSLRPVMTMEFIPELDSIVRFEGELTLVELIQNLGEFDRLREVNGLALRQGRRILLTPLRLLIPELDTLPPIYRDFPRKISNGIKIASMLASRGCLFNCSFCSIHQFYGGANGRLRRTRSPKAVVDEMATLFLENGVQFFSFQDDDFASRSPQQRKWLAEFLDDLDKAELSDKIGWKISCRVDDIEPKTLESMLRHGLMAVYLGVESGNEIGLRTLNKHTNVSQNLRAIELLKTHDVALAMGFMLFDPSSTIESIRQNIHFLKVVGEDGYFPINFCKMLPYAGTPIEASLREAGRLRGTLSQPDYDFVDPKLNWYAFLVQRIFLRRNFHSLGLVARLQSADFDNRILEHLDHHKSTNGHRTKFRDLIMRGNIIAVETLSKLLDQVITRGADALIKDEDMLLELAQDEWREEASIETEISAYCPPEEVHGETSTLHKSGLN